MHISLPKNIRIPTIFEGLPNRIYIDGSPVNIGGNILIVYRILHSYGVSLAEDPHNRDYLCGEVSGEAERWASAATSNDTILLGRTIGRFSDFVLLSQNGAPVKDGDEVKAAFAAIVEEGMVLPFLFSLISESALNGGPPVCLEDYIWLAENCEAPPEINLEHIEEWLREIHSLYESTHLLLTAKGVKRLTEMYIAAVLERLSMRYQIRNVVAAMPLLSDVGEAPAVHKAVLRWLDSARNL